MNQAEENSSILIPTTSDYISDSEKNLLECYADCEEFQPGHTIQLGIEKTGMLCYKVPRDLSEIDIC